MTISPPHPIRPHPDGAQERLERLRGLVTFLETALRIPGTRIRFGADAVIGLVPGLGDVVGGVLSALVVTEAIRSGVPGPVILRMAWNVGVDLVVGAVPVAGDLFDLFWKSGVRNLALLERYHDQPARVTAATRRALLGIAVAFGLLATGTMLLGVALALALFRWLTGAG